MVDDEAPQGFQGDAREKGINKIKKIAEFLFFVFCTIALQQRGIIDGWTPLGRPLNNRMLIETELTHDRRQLSFKNEWHSALSSH